MIASLTGTVTCADATQCVMDVHGVGYRLLVPPGTAEALRAGETSRLHTTLVVREESMSLYGFARDTERDAFELVQTASGVGPKLALAIVSVLNPAHLRRAILSEDMAALCAVPGVGRKGAQRLIIELKDKVLSLDEEETGQEDVASEGPQAWRTQVSEGLQGLGWSLRDAEAACDNVAHLVDEDQGITAAHLLRAALKSLARH